MNLPIVDFETAKDLKELGFDWRTEKQYAEVLSPKENGYRPLSKRGYTSKVQIIPVDNWYQDPIYAPTQAEICKWLRDVHDISLEVQITFPPDDRPDRKWIVCIWDYAANTVGKAELLSARDSLFFNTYEAAELDGIKEAIEILKKRYCRYGLAKRQVF